MAEESNLSRRQTLLGLASTSLLAAAGNSSPRPFRVAVPQKKIDRILKRVREAEWPDRLEAPAWQYGANWDYMKDLAAHWTTKFDWRKAEAKLNAHPQFIAQINGFDIHYYHVRGKGPHPFPVVLTHGWPGSVVEFQDAIELLTNPLASGGSPDDAFDVVIPSLPGFGFSSKPPSPVGPVTIAKLWHKLMTEVAGYTRFGAQGGDWGQSVTIQLASQFPQSLAGIHFTGTTARTLPEAEQNDEEKAWVRASGAYRQTELDYFGEQSRKPQTVGFALADSPLGTAAWIVEKFKSWSDSDTGPAGVERAFTKDQLLTNIMWYLVTDTAATGVWIYRGSADERAAPRGKIAIPTGFAAFPKEMPIFLPPRRFLENDFNLTHYTRMPRGGHFACMEQPKLFVEDLRTFFRTVRG
ncbi:MAG TPA: epoxide hydrolase [Bryobacteraceae bacterium]|nr:epoxide hydrolase [Bryobacteraceae bacterium]